jgi:hypothetical protein
MLAYSRAAGRKITEDFNKLKSFLEPCIQCSYIAYLIVALCAGSGNLIANIGFLTCSVSYFTFYVYAKIARLEKKQTKKITKIYAYAKKTVKLLNLVITIYSITIAAMELSLLQVLFSILLIVGFILDIFFIILGYIFEEWIAYLFAGIEKDFAPIFGLVKLFNKNKGAPEKDIEPSKASLYLEQMVELEEDTAKENKRKEKELRKELKKRKKANKRNHAPDVLDEIAAGKDKK